VVAKKRAEVSWLREVESVMSQCGKFEFNMRWLTGMLKDDRGVGATGENVGNAD